VDIHTPQRNSGPNRSITTGAIGQWCIGVVGNAGTARASTAAGGGEGQQRVASRPPNRVPSVRFLPLEAAVRALGEQLEIANSALVAERERAERSERRTDEPQALLTEERRQAQRAAPDTRGIIKEVIREIAGAAPPGRRIRRAAASPSKPNTA